MSDFHTKLQDITNSFKNKAYHFEELALEIYFLQRAFNPVYRHFLKLSGRLHEPVHSLSDITYCPVHLFKTREIKTGEWITDQVFRSSGTGGITSVHHLASLDEYHQNCREIFENNYGPLSEVCIIGFLPGYHENPHSSLVSMVNHLMNHAKQEGSGFYLHDLDAFYQRLLHLRNQDFRTILFGVSFALLEFGQKYAPTHLQNLTVIETGGMKRRRREITRGELHAQLSQIFSGAQIHSEYGMTECLSQMYSHNEGKFHINRHVQAVISDPSDPFFMLRNGQKGRINLIDLANIHSISFLATDDIGHINHDGTLEISGRLDHSDLRGCNYLI